MARGSVRSGPSSVDSPHGRAHGLDRAMCVGSAACMGSDPALEAIDAAGAAQVNIQPRVTQAACLIDVPCRSQRADKRWRTTTLDGLAAAKA
eukprot:CAMPEP_0119315944 /NCGR_PEP_ID=MMETSP1333-20130426/37864_1 /TAXON_ID=418940 /ORGANISM="Scyphosphaera apsteinii, Strain RCC1455" /LENGTH=91 /DNA_ID=CAMNT_0007321449 /DNA_START=744 /DNA_END=1020 /DNA_ORIENTATION=-